nr:hypothetical protein [Tanacetum cinerariifolium]
DQTKQWHDVSRSKERDTDEGVIGDSIHFDTLGDMQEFVKMLVSIVTRKSMKLARILKLLNHVILKSKVHCLNRNRGKLVHHDHSMMAGTIPP